MNKIMITGVTGGLGKEAAALLAGKIDKSNIVGLARDLSKAEPLKEMGVEVRQGDYDDYNSLLKAFKGIDNLYFISASDIPNRAAQHERVVKAAKEAGIKHVVYTSFMRKNETDSSPIALLAQAHVNTEKLLKESGMNYTILKHGLYTDIIPMFVGENVLETGIVYFPAGDGKTAYATRSDLAKAGVSVLTGTGHENKTYDLSGSKAYSYGDIAEELSKISGKEIKYVSPSKEEFTKTLSDAGVPAGMIDLSIGFSEAIKQGEFEETSDAIETLTGESEISLTEFLAAVYKV